MNNATLSGLLQPKTILEQLKIKKGMKIAELGCGTGFFTLEVAKIVGKRGIVYAVDILKPLLRSIENKAKVEGLDNIKTVWSNLEIVGATKIKDNFLDLAFVSNVLFQSKKRTKLLEEAVRMIKKEGKLILIDWKEEAPFGPPVSDRVSPKEIKDIAQKLGLKLEKEFDAGNYHFGLIFIK